MEKIKTVMTQIAFLKQVKGSDTKLRIQKLQQKLDSLIKKSNGRSKNKTS
jgi:hypothetical protein